MKILSSRKEEERPAPAWTSLKAFYDLIHDDAPVRNKLIFCPTNDPIEIDTVVDISNCTFVLAGRPPGYYIVMHQNAGGDFSNCTFTFTE